MKNKIYWVADYTTETHPGGAQITNKLIIDEGVKLGKKIEVIDLRNIDDHNIDLGGKYIINNISALFNSHRGKIKEIIDKTKFIRYEHDYLWLATNEYLFTREVFKKASGVVLLSPLHRERHETILSMDFSKCRLQPSPVGLTFKKKEKNGRAIYLGGIANHKGVNNIIEYAKKNPQLNIDMYGWVENQEIISYLPENVKFLGVLSREEVNDKLSEYTYLIHMPNWIEPFGRIIIEALYAGCELITNDKIGALSYDWIKNGNIKLIRKKLEEEKINFWKYIDSI